MDMYDFLEDSVIFLSAAVILVPIAQALNLGSVLGYLLAGVVIGPWGIGFIDDFEEILHFSELGVVLLLFIIGLELNPGKLWQMRKPILGLGGAQVLFSVGVIAPVVHFIGIDWNSSLVIGMGLALSSTAIALRIIEEKEMSGSLVGESSFSVLLFQDIAVIPMLALLPLLAGTEVTIESSIWKVVGIFGLLIGGRYLLQPLFRFVVSSGVRELFTVATLLVIVVIAIIMHTLDLSMALGSFLAGVLLAESEYRHELERSIEPFKGLLLGLFFIAIGMSVDLELLLLYPLEILFCVVCLVLIKSAVIYTLARSFGLRWEPSSTMAILLSQGGEFAFVLFTVAQEKNILDQGIADFLLVVVSVSMVTTPLLLLLNGKLCAYWVNVKGKYEQEPPNLNNDTLDSQGVQVIISEFGRFGQIVGRLLYANKIKVTVLEKNVDQVTLLRRHGYKVYYGDATQLDLLRAAGADKAKAIVLCNNSPRELIQTVHLCKHYFPHLVILARARGRAEAHQLDKEDVHFSRETFLSAVDLGRQALVQLGMHPYKAKRAERQFRQIDAKMLKELFLANDTDEDLLTQAIKVREELDAIFDKEVKIDENVQNYWK